MDIILYWFLNWFFFAIIVGAWANKWGRSYFGFFILSIVLSPILSAFILLIVGKLHGGVGKKKCPDCAEYIQEEAVLCRFCGYEFEEEEENSVAFPNKQQKVNWKPVAVIGLIIFAFGLFYYFINYIFFEV